MSNQAKEFLHILPATPTPLALPHWFDEPMIALLLPEMSEAEREVELDTLLSMGIVEFISGRGSERYQVPPRLRAEQLQNWMSSHETHFLELSRNIARYCAEQARLARTDPARRDEWRVEQLYHLVVVEPGRAMQLMKTWFQKAVEERFDLNRGHRWLSPLEERRDWLLQLERARQPEPSWTEELTRLREYLSARAYWSEEWFKSITYLPRDGLLEQLNQFFAPKSTNWLLNLHAPGGHGKTATLEWLLTRYALPHGYVCARVDFETLTNTELLEIAEQPFQLLTRLAQNLNEQRSQKLAVLDRLNSLRGDPAGSFALVLREVYAGQTVVIFLDTLDKLLEATAQPGPVLESLFGMFGRIRQGDIAQGGSLQGYVNLRLVSSGRGSLLEKYSSQLAQALKINRKRAKLPILEIRLDNFTPEEAGRYLEQTRKLGSRSSELVEAILKKTAQQGKISPLQLALYADLVKQDPTLTPQIIENAPQVDVAYLVNRIIRHIQDPAVHWLARYGVIFRHLDENRASLLLTLLEKVMASNQDLDNPQLPTELLSFEPNIQWPVRALLDQLTRYSWIERQGEYLVYHPTVAQPQTEMIKKQAAWPILQKIAFAYFAERAERNADPFKKAEFLREALYHAWQTPQAGKTWWQAQFEHYRAGPGPVLFALVEESWPANVTFDTLTTDDYYRAQLALADVLLAEKERPFLPDQLKKAEEAVKKAVGLNTTHAKFPAYLLAAKIALAGRKVAEALDLAYRALGEARTAEQQLEALHVTGQVEAANSMWDKAIATLRMAYQRLKETGGSKETLVALQLELIEKLMPGVHWQEAVELAAEARKLMPGHPVVLEYSAGLAFKLGRLQEAATYYRQAAQRQAGAQAEQTNLALRKLEFYQGQISIPTATGYSEAALLSAAARADWPGLETVLRTQLANVPETETLEVINLLVQFYLEVSGDWRQVRALLERGANLATARPASDPAIARLNIMQQYMDFSSSRPPTEPEAAYLECERRTKQVAALQTPEARVRAKGYLLLVRFFGDINEEETGPTAQIYTKYAAEALEQALALLLKLAPQDQIDIMRTIAALPGWSSALLNEYTLDPAEREPLRLLEEYLKTPQNGANGINRVNSTFLTRLLQRSGLVVDASLQTLQQQIEKSGSDWAVLYSSFGRLLAAFGQIEAAQTFLNRYNLAQNSETLATPNLNIVAIYDQAYLAGWKAGQTILRDVVARLEMLPGATGIVNELMLNLAYLGLLYDIHQPYREGITISILLSRFFAMQFLAPANRLFLLHFFALQLLVELRLNHRAKADYYLRQALNISDGLGNLYAVEILKRFIPILETTSSPNTGNENLVRGAFCLNITQIDPANLVVALERVGRTLYERRTNLTAIKKLLPQGKLLTGLPDLDFWQKLLNNDSNLNLPLEQVGGALLDEILPPRSRGRKALAGLPAASGRDMSTLQLNVQGHAIEQIPWGILYEPEQGWLSRRFRFVRNSAEFGAALTGVAIAVKPLPSRPDPAHILKQIEILYRPRTDGFRQPLTTRLYSAELFERLQPAQQTSNLLLPSLPVLPTEVKMLHLLGDIRELPGEDIPYFSVGQTRRQTMREHLTPDALAHFLRQLGIGRTLIILEPLSTGAIFEDGRVLLLRNLFASQLAQLGNWLVLAIGPRLHTSELIARLVQAEAITGENLENWLQQARRSIPPGENLPESQLALFYPTLQ